MNYEEIIKYLFDKDKEFKEFFEGQFQIFSCMGF